MLVDLTHLVVHGVDQSGIERAVNKVERVLSVFSDGGRSDPGPELPGTQDLPLPAGGASGEQVIPISARLFGREKGRPFPVRVQGDVPGGENMMREVDAGRTQHPTLEDLCLVLALHGSEIRCLGGIEELHGF